MAGYFSIALSVSDGGSPGVKEVDVTVASEQHYSGSVTLTFSYQGATAPNYISPLSAVVHVPKNGSVGANVEVGLNVGDSILFVADGVDGVLGDSATIPVSA